MIKEFWKCKNRVEIFRLFHILSPMQFKKHQTDNSNNINSWNNNNCNNNNNSSNDVIQYDRFFSLFSFKRIKGLLVSTYFWQQKCFDVVVDVVVVVCLMLICKGYSDYTLHSFSWGVGGGGHGGTRQCL